MERTNSKSNIIDVIERNQDSISIRKSDSIVDSIIKEYYESLNEDVRKKIYSNVVNILEASVTCPCRMSKIVSVIHKTLWVGYANDTWRRDDLSRVLYANIHRTGLLSKITKIEEEKISVGCNLLDSHSIDAIEHLKTMIFKASALARDDISLNTFVTVKILWDTMVKWRLCIFSTFDCFIDALSLTPKDAFCVPFFETNLAMAIKDLGILRFDKEFVKKKFKKFSTYDEVPYSDNDFKDMSDMIKTSMIISITYNLLREKCTPEFVVPRVDDNEYEMLDYYLSDRITTISEFVSLAMAWDNNVRAECVDKLKSVMQDGVFGYIFSKLCI